MSKVARRKQLLTATPAMSMPSIVADGPATSFAVPASPAAAPPLHAPDGRAIRVVHIVAELAPFARSGGLGEAVNSLARFQSARGVPTSIVMPLYDIAHENVPGIEPIDGPFEVQVGRRSEKVRLWKLVAPPDHPLAATDVYFIESEEYFNRPYIYGPPGS